MHGSRPTGRRDDPHNHSVATRLTRPKPQLVCRRWVARAVVVVGMEPWTAMEQSFEKAADQLICHLDLSSRKAEVCLTGGSGGSFCAMILAAMMAQRMPGVAVKVVAFSLVTWLHRRDGDKEHYWPHMIGDFMNCPATLAGMRKYGALRTHFERAMSTPGADLQVKAFVTPLSQMDWTQLTYISDLPCVRYEEVMTDDYNHDMMAWTVLPARENNLVKQKMMQWMKIRNPNWPQRTLETRVERETQVALEWRLKYPDVASLFTNFSSDRDRPGTLTQGPRLGQS